VHGRTIQLENGSFNQGMKPAIFKSIGLSKDKLTTEKKMKILLPVDGSEAADEAVKFVRSLAISNPVDVVVLTVWYDPTHNTIQPWASEWKEFESNRTEIVLKQAKGLLQDVCNSVKLLCDSGSTAYTILDHAVKSNVDLIVLGAKGHSTVSRILLGSVSDTVAAGAKCSVVVVRPTIDRKNVTDKILLGYDQSVPSREAVAELMLWKLPRDSEIDVVSVAFEPFPFIAEDMKSPMTIDPQQVQKNDEAAERMASQISEHFPQTKVVTTISDHVGNAIVAKAEKERASLVVVGDSGQGLFGRFLMGSTSRYVLRHAPCSVWISRHHWNTQSKTKGTADTVAAQ